jgi:NTE family protein
MKRWGIALGAGGILGFAHIGVLEALESRGLRPSFVAGTSAGAILGGLWASGVKLSSIRYQMETLVLDEPVRILPGDLADQGSGVPATAIQGLLGTAWIESALARLTGNKMISDVEIPLSIVSCDLHTGDTVVFTNRPPRSKNSPGTLPIGHDIYPERDRRYITRVRLATAIMASAALPGVFVPRKVFNSKLVDGGVKEMVPAYEVRRLGAEEVLSVDLGSYIDRRQEVRGVYSVLSRSFNLATRAATLEHLRKYSSLTLTPPVWEPGLPTPSKIRSLVEAGRRCAEKHMEEWLALIGLQEIR